MVPHEDIIRLRHMLDYSQEALSHVEGRLYSDLDESRLLGLALIRLLEVIGEAAARVSIETRKECSEIPWPLIISLRNRLIHGYDSVDMDVVWKIMDEDLPPLAAQLTQILQRLS